MTLTTRRISKLFCYIGIEIKVFAYPVFNYE